MACSSSSPTSSFCVFRQRHCQPGRAVVTASRVCHCKTTPWCSCYIGGMWPAHCCHEALGGSLCVQRKNRPQGSRLVRSCWCAQSQVHRRALHQAASTFWLWQATCPVHVLGPYLEEIAEGDQLFGGISAADATEALRLILKELGVAQAQAYRTHDMRRGHALDLQVSGELVVSACLGMLAWTPRQARLSTRSWPRASGPRRPSCSIWITGVWRRLP